MTAPLHERLPETPPDEWIEAMAIGMLNGYGANMIDPDIPSIGRDLKTRRAIENRMIEARSAYAALRTAQEQQAMTDTIMPCPFCGGDSAYAHNEGMLGTILAVHFIVCGMCEANGPAAHSESEAWTNWRKRAAQEHTP